MPASSSLTRWSLGAALVAAVAVGVAWAVSGGGIFSPGALHAGRDGGASMGGVVSHAELSGDCASCHAPPVGDARMADRCLFCHVEVRAELGDSTKLHGILPNAGECLGCHVEHRGPRAVLTEFSGEGFPHERLGFALAAHQETAGGREFTCSDCHGGDSFRFAQSTCATCHADYQAAFVARHVREWGEGCMACHDGVDRFSGFRHDSLAFRLTGSHPEVNCVQCHAPVRELAAFANAPETCVGCHRPDDPHRGSYGPDCAACHTTERWDDATFRHTFPLDHGGEGAVACLTCHQDMAARPSDGRGGAGTPSFRTYTCYGCHVHAPAIIREEHLDEGIRDFRDCVSCHATGQEREGDRGRGGRDDRRDDRGRDDDRRGRGRGGRET